MRISWIKALFAFFLIAGLPIFVWAVATQRIELRKRAATAEPTQICWNRVISFNDTYHWPNSCKGSPRTDLTCSQVLVPLSPDEVTGYKSWISAGKPYIPGCGPAPTPPPTPIAVCLPTGDNYCQNHGGIALTVPYDVTDWAQCLSWCNLNMTSSMSLCQYNADGPRNCWVNKPPTGGIASCNWVAGKPPYGACYSRTPTPTPYQSPTPTPTPTCTPYPACYYPISPDQPRCTLTSGVNYCPPMPIMPIFTLSVNGAVPELLPNQVMPLTIKISEHDGSAGTPTEGLNVQAAVDVWPLSGNTPAVFSQNAVFNPNTQLWELTVPRPQNVGTYRLQVHAYCAQDNSLCAVRYGQARQLEWEYHFSAVIPPPQNLTFKVKLVGVNSAEAKGATIKVKFKLQNGTVLPIETPLVLNPVGNGAYEATATLTNPLPSGTAMRVLVKGEKHSQVVFCRASGQTEPCNDTEYITPSSYSFDFTGRPLPPGDLNHDGKVNAVDVKLITDLFNKPSSQQTPQDLKTADVNYSGKVDSLDLSLVFQTLETRYDEQ